MYRALERLEPGLLPTGILMLYQLSYTTDNECRYVDITCIPMGGATAGDGGTGPPLSEVSGVQSPAIDEALFNR